MDATEQLWVRELTEQDIPAICHYWSDSTDEHLLAMGVDLSKVPTSEDLTRMLQEQISLPHSEKSSLCMVWFYNETPIGHSNVNKITFGESAFVHLHIWTSSFRKKGLGAQFVTLSIPYFFQLLELETLYCEPFSENPAPNKTMEKLGFEFVKTYITIPGSINVEQQVNQWMLTRKKFEQLFS